MFSEQLKKARTEAGLSQKALAERLNFSQQAVAKWETGVSTPTPETIKRISEVLGVSASQLLGSIDPAPKPSTPSAVVIPVLGDVAAGVPMLAVENIIGYEEVPAEMAKDCELFGLRIRGSSMEPRIREGDVVIVRKQDTADSGDTAVVLVNGDSATVKRIKKEPGGIALIPNNPAFEVKYYSAAEIADLPVTIVGKVIELRGKF